MHLIDCEGHYRSLTGIIYINERKIAQILLCLWLAVAVDHINSPTTFSQPKQAKPSTNTKIDKQPQTINKGKQHELIKKISNKTSHSHGNGNLLVPPPPPDTPIAPWAISPTDILLTNIPLYYLTADDLKHRKQDLINQVKQAKDELKDKQLQVEDMSMRATNFANLYDEGVVSRHELDVAKSDAETAQKELERAQTKLVQLEELATRIENKLGTQNKASSKNTKKIK